MRAVCAILALLCASLVLVGCYAPDAPSGSYTCGAHDSCPNGLSCTCGLCVSSPEQAACSFSITSPDATTVTNRGHTITSLTRAEHETFTVNVTAFSDAAGTQASTFSGPVTLSSTWGDVCVGTAGCMSTPNTVQMSGGAATATIQLNRATIPPQSAVLRASFAGNIGDSGDLRLTVTPPSFTDDTVITAPLDYGFLKPTTATFGFANASAGQPSVVKTSTGWTMYYLGLNATGNTAATVQVTGGIGVATSTDGITFIPQAQSIYSGAFYASGAQTLATTFGAPSAHVSALGTAIYFGLNENAMYQGYTALENITQMPGAAAFSLPSPLLQTTDVPAPINTSNSTTTVTNVVTGVDTPTVIADPAPALTGGGPNASVMYASAVIRTTTTTKATMAMTTKSVVAVVRALASDGINFQVDPSPVLQSTLEIPVFYAPRVIVDGSVYKMFFATVDGLAALTGIDVTNPCVSTYFVGYATSTDGSFWIPSVNSAGIPVPVFAAADGMTSVLATTIVPVDGVDPSSGLLMYYSPYSNKNVAGVCWANGIDRGKSAH